MATYTTLEEINTGLKTNSSSDKWSLRPEQREAIDLAKERFCKRSGTRNNYVWTLRPEYKQFLWNAKMRFGKTMCALQLAREIGVKSTLIVTHRPVVNQSWNDDFVNVFGDKLEGNDNVKKYYAYGTLADDKQRDKRKFYDLRTFVKDNDENHFVFFVSMQYLVLSELVNPTTKAKNDERRKSGTWGHSDSEENEKIKADILNYDWDFVVIDEAHEGTRTPLGKKVIDEYLKKEGTKILHLSGTPFNLYEDFAKDEIFTWDYISEQTAKRKWAEEKPDEVNPYAELPKMKICHYDIKQNLQNIIDASGIFTFPEFFRVWTGNPKADRASMPEGAKGRFVHEDEVTKFLNLLCTKDATNNFPFSTDEYRRSFRHTLWVVSHVDEARALSQLLKEHRIFKRFTIINVAGTGDKDEQLDNALDAVNKAIGDSPEKTSTITISCGRLTTGVTVKPWSAVLYLRGGEGSATYMQTIFRVQSPYKTPDGKMKTECYVFDFDPIRSMKMVAETAKFSSMAKANEASGDEEKTQEMRDKETLSAFLELCPVISMDGGIMLPLDVEEVFKQLEDVYIDRLVHKGFDDPCLYDQTELNKINPDIINKIGENGGKAPDENRKEAKKAIDLDNLTDEERKAYEDSVRKKKEEAKKKAEEKIKKDEAFKKQWESWTEEQREEYLKKEAEKAAHRELLKQQREEFKKRITNIRGIALRIPLLMYGGADAGDPKDDLTVENFTRKIKDESWAEFMPKGITKEDFNKIKHCFNATRFEEAGKKYRALTREADFMHVDERIKQITEIFSYFRNPDKETVLTPWRVVNMHMSDTLGGYCFYDETFDEEHGKLENPRYVDQGDVTKRLFDNVDLAGEVQTKILEINSKTGLYPLYVTYSLYRRRLEEYIKAQCIDIDTVSVQEEQVVWDDIVTDNIFVICNTPMAVGITRRTLFGFREVDVKANIKNEKLIEKATKSSEQLINEIKSIGFWKGNRNNNMIDFNAIVGNPPYQVMDGGTQTGAVPVYNKFVDLARNINPQYVSMIMPAKWYNGGRNLDEFRASMLSDKHVSRLFDYLDSSEIFNTVDVAGGVCYFLWDKFHDGLCSVTTHNHLAVSTHERKLDEFDTYIRYYEGVNILKKVLEKENHFLNETASSQKPFGLRTYARPQDTGDLTLVSSGGTGPFKRDEVPAGLDWIDKWKLMTSIRTQEHAGQADKDGMKRILSRTEILPPCHICTESYIIINVQDSKDSIENVYSYIKTRFVRFMMSLVTSSQAINKQSFVYVPIQDFSKPWTDEELYNKYNLDIFERQYIESLIKPMD